MDLASKAKDALQAGEYDVAVAKYTEALAQTPSAVPYYIGRSTAYQRSSPPNLEAALKDAEIAVNLATKRAKRELIAEAQQRRAVTLFALGQYANAGYVFGLVKKFNDKDKTVGVWEIKIQNKLKGIAEDDEARKVTAVDVPDTEPDAAPTTKSEQKAPAQPAAPQQTPVDKVRHEWYTSSDNIVISLFAKGVPKDKVVVDIEERSVSFLGDIRACKANAAQLSVSFPVANSTTYEFNLDPLFAPIVVDKSTFNVTPTKVEITLKKATPGLKWSKLESSDESLLATATSTLATKPSASGPSYPTSSRSGPKDWDKLASELTQKKDGKTEAGEDEFDDDDDGGDPANAFFRKLYKNADPDTRRAMMKSYQESNGTALSTNWSEVSKAPVETSPPEGMEAKKWDS
ncbi:putative sgt1 and cs domain containing protein [Neofusicoccum parvum]|uniref:Putative sgt1 and cs domain containing protein n=1 Tax=Botryosphaeria parva (strain UCR-NP2) TaxID=1287680 RepID=R1EB61_BOTPV|nr:putative sgt1 and cs domain containing protein [Neofusicoccum parvum UCRNP2]GME60760.1 putative sgt1 and cs domain containing protein [Neofusicoccum parvum]